MPVIERNINLQVPVETVCHYLCDPSHLTDFCSNVIEVNEVQHHPPNGAKFAWIYKMLGVRAYGEAEVKETKHHQELTIHFWGSIRGTFTWQVQPSDDGVLLAVKLDYTVPQPLLKKHTEEAILYQNERAIEDMLTNLKSLLETHDARTLNSV